MNKISVSVYADFAFYKENVKVFTEILLTFVKSVNGSSFPVTKQKKVNWFSWKEEGEKTVYNNRKIK